MEELTSPPRFADPLAAYRTAPSSSQALLPDLRAPSVKSYTCRFACVLLPFLVLFAVFLGLFLQTSEEGTQSGHAWRLTPTSDATQPTKWQICGIRLYTDRYCNDEIEVSSSDASVILWDGSSRVPISVFSRDSECYDIWTDNITTVPWIGIDFHRSRTVRCAKVYQGAATIGCSSIGGPNCWFVRCSTSSCPASCCYPTQLPYGFSDMVVERTNSPNKRSSWRTALKPASWDAHSFVSDIPRISNTWIIYLVVFVVFGSFVLGLLLVFPCLICALQGVARSIEALKSQVQNGSAIAYQCDDQRWGAFVEAEYGPGGRRRKAHLHWSWLVAILLSGPLLMVIVKLKNLRSDQNISWPLLALICVPTGAGATLLTWIVMWFKIVMQYRAGKRKNMWIVIGPGAMFFDRFHAFAGAYQRNFGCQPRALIVQSSSIVQYVDGPTLVIDCQRVTKEGVVQPRTSQFIVRVPLDEHHKQTVFDYLNLHRATFKPRNMPVAHQPLPVANASVVTATQKQVL